MRLKSASPRVRGRPLKYCASHPLQKRFQNQSMKIIFPLASLLLFVQGYSQASYQDSINTFLKTYVTNHEVVKGEDKKFMRFYPVNKAYRVVASFAPSSSTGWLTFKTSGPKNKVFKLYGTLSFVLNGKACRLNAYQSQELMTNAEYKNYLFLPFTDSTTGNETYASGRYLDLNTTDVGNGKVVLDFNKAYNPYCAYVSGVYNCPVPPKENALPVAVKAGEKAFGKAH